MKTKCITTTLLCTLISTGLLYAEGLHDQLQGNWQVDQEASWQEYTATAEYQEMKPEEQASQETMIKKMFADMRVTFTPDIAIFSVQTTSRQSPYSIVSTEGNMMAINATINGKQENVTILFTDPNHISFLPEEESQMRFILIRE